MPEVTVIIPVRNADATIDEQLEALASQRLSVPWEILVADNGSTDGTASRAHEWSGRVPVRVIDASQRVGPNAARNIAAGNARGAKLLFCDGDDVVAEGWANALVTALDDVEAVGGRLDLDRLNDPSTRARHPNIAIDGLFAWSGFLSYAITANLGVRRETFDALGGFDETFSTGGDDVDFCWRLQLMGCRLGFASDAVVSYRLRQDEAGLVRQRYRYGIGEAQLYRKFRYSGMPRRTTRIAARTLASLIWHAPQSLRGDPRARSAWLREAATRWGNIVGSTKYRVPYL